MKKTLFGIKGRSYEFTTKLGKTFKICWSEFKASRTCKSIFLGLEDNCLFLATIVCVWKIVFCMSMNHNEVVLPRVQMQFPIF